MTVERVLCLAMLQLCLLAGCATVDFDYPRTESSAFTDTGDTLLGQRVGQLAADRKAKQSGFYVLSDGIEALTARLQLAARAERSIDLQYYLIKNDITGRALINSLLQAADRGVRVRLLLDDILTSGYDDAFAGLDAHPNFEIRIFNPFARGVAGRAGSSVTEFARINRRMHNKSFTVDNQVTIVGGRNIADEYFGAREDAKFSDLDVAGVGPVVADVSEMFDTYWRHRTAVPVPGFAKMPDDPAAELERVRRGLSKSMDEVSQSVYADAVRQQAVKFLALDRTVLVWAPYTLVYDSPDKGMRKRADEAASIRTPLVDALRAAERRVILVSPYFVPRKSGVEAINAMEDRGVEVTIITNSLAANNQFTVHSGYAPSRKPLLLGGAELYEVRSDAEVAGAELVAVSGAKATLHTKAFLVDDDVVFIGSFNFDPRSAFINTESGVIIESPRLASQFSSTIDQALPRQTYKLFLNERGKLRWRASEADAEVIYDKEPATTWAQRWSANLMRILPIRGQL